MNKTTHIFPQIKINVCVKTVLWKNVYEKNIVKYKLKHEVNIIYSLYYSLYLLATDTDSIDAITRSKEYWIQEKKGLSNSRRLSTTTTNISEY